jgi:hypothetical protein
VLVDVFILSDARETEKGRFNIPQPLGDNEQQKNNE